MFSNFGTYRFAQGRDIYKDLSFEERRNTLSSINRLHDSDSLTQSDSC